MPDHEGPRREFQTIGTAMKKDRRPSVVSSSSGGGDIVYY